MQENCRHDRAGTAAAAVAVEGKGGPTHPTAAALSNPGDGRGVKGRAEAEGASVDDCSGDMGSGGMGDGGIGGGGVGGGGMLGGGIGRGMSGGMLLRLQA